MPSDAYLKIWTNRPDGAVSTANEKVSGGCVAAGWGWTDEPPTYSQGYELDLPTTIPAGRSYTCTIIQTMTNKDVASGGTSGSFMFQTRSSSSPLRWYMYAADGKSLTPKIAGSAVMGVALKTSSAYWSLWNQSFRFQWLREGSPISGATKSSYTPVAADVGKKLSVQIRGYSEGGSWISRTTAATAPVAGTLVAPTPTVSGTAKVGSKLTAVPGSWTSGTSLSYQWLANGVAISKATGSTFTVTSAQRGKTITVKVTGTKSGYTTVPKTSAPTGKVP